MSILAETTIPGQDTQGGLGRASFQDPSKGPDDFVQAPTEGWHIGAPAAFFREIVRVPVHPVHCSWCGLVLRVGDPTLAISHSICAADLAKVRAEMAYRRAAKENA